jgi:endoglucanase
MDARQDGPRLNGANKMIGAIELDLKLEIPMLVLFVIVVCAITTVGKGSELDGALWNTYKKDFLAPEGRVIDTANHGISHSEGQGYGMLLAESYGDRETFELLWRWTTKNLARAQDHLFSWRWNPAGGRVDDVNDAADGDLLIAWALARAGEHWQNRAWRDSARMIAQDIRTKLVRKSEFGPLLLPGEVGFNKSDGYIVNLSYWIFPAFRGLNKISPSPVWRELETSGLSLLRRARYSSWMLPPDWLLVNGAKLRVAPGFPPTYGYNAVRIPLYQAWAGITKALYYESFRRYASDNNGEPAAEVSLETGELKKTPALPGMLAIYQLIAGSGDLDLSAMAAPYKGIAPDESYFSASLGLLSNLAALEASSQMR